MPSVVILHHTLKVKTFFCLNDYVKPYVGLCQFCDKDNKYLFINLKINNNNINNNNNNDNNNNNNNKIRIRIISNK